MKKAINGNGKAKSLKKKRSAGKIDALVGSRIRIRRNELGMSQDELGSRLGVSFQQIQKYEKGVNRLSIGRLLEVANVLETTMSYFCEGYDKNDNETVSPYGQFMMTQEGPMIMEAMIALEQQHLRRAVITLARELAG